MPAPSPAARSRPWIVVLLAGLLVGTACGTEGPSGERAPAAADDPAGSIDSTAAGSDIRVTDDSGATVRLARPPRRVVSLVPSATETILALGLGHRVVGRTDFDTEAPLDTLPSVGGGLHPSLEALVVLDPDLVIRFAGETDQATPARLDEFGIPHLAVRPDGIDDVRRIIDLLGRVGGVSRRADSLVAAMDSALEAVARRVDTLPSRRVAFVLEGPQHWVAGPGTFVDELLTIAGGENVFGDLDRLYGPVSEEVLVSRPIDLFLAVEGAQLDLPRDDVPVAYVPPGIQTPGPDVAEAARALARILHPDAFP